MPNLLRRMGARTTVLAFLVALAVALAAVSLRDRWVGDQRAQRLDLEATNMAALVDSVSSNGALMTGATILGVLDLQAKKIVLAPKDPVDSGTLAKFDAAIQILHARSASLVDASGREALTLDSSGTLLGRNPDALPVPFFDLLQAGLRVVYLDIPHGKKALALHLAAPIYAAQSSSSKVIGAYYLEAGLSEVQAVLESFRPRAALLLSPDGKVFASNLSEALQQQLLKQDRLERPEDFGYRMAAQEIGWTAQTGAWQVVLLEPEFDVADNTIRAALGASILLVLFGCTLLFRRYRQALIDKQQEQERALRKYADQTDFQERLMDAVPTPMFVKDADGRAVGINRAFEEA